ncbi:MAG: glycosyltransferase [Deltaproteobacteria bacterium]|nr:glycosyltransferase [Deltaproteobacteria bacterium]
MIVVDNGSGDSTADVARSFARKLPLRLFSEARPGIPRCRNRCLREARNRVLAFTDDDCKVPPDWIQRIATYHEAYPGAAAIGGPVVNGAPGLLGETNQRMWESWLCAYREAPKSGTSDIRFRTPARIPHVLKRPAQVRSLFTANCSYKVVSIRRIGGFNESLLTMSDEELNWRLCNSGERLLYIPDMPVVHAHRGAIASFIEQHFRYGIGFYQTRTLHPGMPGILPRSTLVSVWMFPILALTQALFNAGVARLSCKTLPLAVLMWIAETAFRTGALYAGTGHRRAVFLPAPQPAPSRTSAPSAHSHSMAASPKGDTEKTLSCIAPGPTSRGKL